MSDLYIRIEGRAGRITLTRPQALNALTYDMVRAVDAALDAWREDDAVALVLMDAEGDKAFCAGGDIAALYDSGKAGDFAYGRQFWADEYRMNARLAEYPKPIVSLMQGFTMGGGVGLGCHSHHRVLCETSRIAMPECGIGLIPDVGGSLLLARAPGRLGAYLGLTAARMDAGDALMAGFADHYIPQATWPDLITTLCQTGDAEAVTAARKPAPEGALLAHRAWIDALFATGDLPTILTRLRSDDSAFAQDTLKSISRNSPLAMGATLALLARLQDPEATIRTALELEYRFTARAMEHGDFLEGIRAAIIDKDRKPVWNHRIDDLPPEAVEAMLAPLGDAALTF